MNFKFCTHIVNIDWNKSPLQISGKVAVDVVTSQDSKFFRAPIYWAHHTVVFAIAQLSWFFAYMYIIVQ